MHTPNFYLGRVGQGFGGFLGLCEKVSSITTMPGGGLTPCRSSFYLGSAIDSYILWFRYHTLMSYTCQDSRGGPVRTLYSDSLKLPWPQFEELQLLEQSNGKSTPWLSFILTPSTWSHKHPLRPALKDLQLTFSSLIPTSCIGTREYRTATTPPQQKRAWVIEVT